MLARTLRVQSFLTFGLLACGPSATEAQGNGGSAALRAEDCFTRAMMDFDAGDYAAAEGGFDRCLELDPERAYALVYRGWCRFEQGRFDEALADYRTALPLRDDYGLPFHFREMYKICALAGRLDEAERHLTRAVAMQRESWVGQLSIWASDDPRRELDAAVAKHKDHLAYFARANWKIRNDELSDAVRDLEAAVKIKPRFAVAHYHLGRAFDGSLREWDVDYARAAKHYEKALDGLEDCGAVYERLAFCRTRLGDDAAANEALAKGAASDYPTPGLLADRTNAFLDLSERKELLTRAVRLDPKARHLTWPARSITDETLPPGTSDREFQDLAYERGRVRRHPRDLVEGFLSRNPGDAWLSFLMGSILLHEDEDAEGAERHFRAALSADPEFALARCGLADARLKRGDANGAIQEYQARRDRTRDSPSPGTRPGTCSRTGRAGRPPRGCMRRLSKTDTTPGCVTALWRRRGSSWDGTPKRSRPAVSPCGRGTGTTGRSGTARKRGGPPKTGKELFSTSAGRWRSTGGRRAPSSAASSAPRGETSTARWRTSSTRFARTARRTRA